jgi:hypothetical protein
MCQAFSCIVEPSKKVTWKFGVDSHTELQKLAGLSDQTSDPAKMLFARVEITPDNKSYLKPDSWSLRVDESITPTWLTPQHKEACFAAHKKWEAKLRKILVRKEIVHPFELTPPKIGPSQIRLLKECKSVGDSVRASVRDSVWDSVWASVWASVGAYIGSFFIVPKWKYIKHAKGKYPFACFVKLWEQGLVPSFDGKTWRLHGGKKAEILYELSE